MNQNLSNLIQEYQINPDNLPRHIAIIMDGNGRWAKERGLFRTDGHKKGVEVVKKITEFCNDLGIEYLTLHAFSKQNWKRPKKEVDFIVNLAYNYLKENIKELNQNNIKLKAVGDIEELSEKLQQQISEVEELTKNNSQLQLNMALNYGGRFELLQAMKNIALDVKKDKLKISEINESSVEKYLYTKDIPDPDFLIRTSGEKRLSNSFPWQTVYTEFYFPKKHWPDFTKYDLLEAIVDYQKRKRRYGGL